MVTKDQTIVLLEAIARLLELKGENPFKVRAYTNAARALETFSGDFAQAVQQNQLHEIAGIGVALSKKIADFYATGKLAYYEQLRADFPETIFELFELQGLGAKKVKALYDTLKIKNIQELEGACKDGTVAGMPGFGQKTAKNLLQAIEQRRRHSGRYLLSEATVWSESLLAHFQHHPAVSQISAAGSLRRGKETIGDLDFLIATTNPSGVIDHFLTDPSIDRVLAKGETKASVLLHGGIQADLRVVANREFPFALAYFTGSKEHNVALRARALDLGWTLNEYRLAPEPHGKKAAPAIPEVHTEEDLHHALGLDYIAPELRENLGEIEAAARHELPKLVEWTNLRGAFHNHTHASDGRNSLEEMAEAARDLGLEYLGIADHSKSSFQANGLDQHRLLAQVEAIRKLNQQYDGKFRLFAGVECDILKDGQLDFPDEVLRELDYVVASVHASFTQTEEGMTARIVRALQNPYVTFLGHATGRLLLSREPYRVNLGEVIRTAAQTGTAIELNANPRRLDLDWRFWRTAKELGVTCVINPDAHSTQGLHDLWFGILEARKGWLTRADILNCLPLAQVTARLGAKRLRFAGA
jgi:DNA polymerase (family 10)